MDPQLITVLTQFGAAGLMGWLWMSERRAAHERERQVADLHQRLIQDRQCFDIAVGALRENTRVLAAIESNQRLLSDLLRNPQPPQQPEGYPAASR